MRQERQVQLLERVAASGPHLAGLHAETSAWNDASAYTDPSRFADEVRTLFRHGPGFFALSADLAEAGSYRAASVGGVPVVVVRQSDGTLRALVNACRHRGAPLVEPDGGGSGLRAFSCPYHAWTYDLDGALRSRPGSAGAFDDVSDDCSMLPVGVAERYGLIFVHPTSTEPIDVDALLGGLVDDLSAFGLERYVHIESRTSTLKMNWKLFFDTFTESYHIRALHKASLAPTFNSDCVIFEPHGRNLVSIGLRKDVLDETRKPKADWSLLPYATIQYFLVPTGLVVHQIDHVEVWRVEPIDVGTTTVTTSIYAPSPPQSERSRGYFVKNLDLLLQVTGTEDFPLMEQIHTSLASGAFPRVVYGRNEPPLIYFHGTIDRLLQAGRTGVAVG
jgi:phenylpropionate dioxygenase-like ring-hydroxylating dioxygenase large terminal subunit